MKDRKSSNIILKSRESSAGQAWLNRVVNLIDKILGRKIK